MSRRDPAWLAEPVPERRIGVKGPRAAAALAELELAVPARPNSWAPLTATERDDCENVIGRLGTTEFFIEESGDAPRIAELRKRLARGFPGAYSVLRADVALVLGGAAAADALAQVCNIDFAALDVATRPVVMTLMIGVGVLVFPQLTDDGRIYRIWCDPTYGAYLWSELETVVEKINQGRAQ